jgi:hypothetical protein
LFLEQFKPSLFTRQAVRHDDGLWMLLGVTAVSYMEDGVASLS